MRCVTDYTTLLFTLVFFSALHYFLFTVLYLLEALIHEGGGIDFCSLFFALLSRTLRCSRIVQN